MAQLDPAHRRNIIGIVSQEPILFNLSMKEKYPPGQLFSQRPKNIGPLNAAGCS